MRLRQPPCPGAPLGTEPAGAFPAAALGEGSPLEGTPRARFAGASSGAAPGRAPPPRPLPVGGCTLRNPGVGAAAAPGWRSVGEPWVLGGGPHCPWPDGALEMPGRGGGGWARCPCISSAVVQACPQLPDMKPLGLLHFFPHLLCCFYYYFKVSPLKMHSELSCAVSFSFAASRGKCLPVSTTESSLYVLSCGLVSRTSLD